MNSIVLLLLLLFSPSCYGAAGAFLVKKMYSSFGLIFDPGVVDLFTYSVSCI